MSVASLIRRHGQTGSVFRRGNVGKDEFSRQTVEWTLLDSDVPFWIQLLPGSGAVQGQPIGQEAIGEYPAFGNNGIGLVQGDGLRIDAAPDATEVGRSFIVERGKDFGRRGGWQGEVSETDEDFTNGAS